MSGKIAHTKVSRIALDLNYRLSFNFILLFSLWRLFSADYVHLNEIGVPLLINSLTYESGKSTFWNLVDKDFKDSSWKVRMQAGNFLMLIFIL